MRDSWADESDPWKKADLMEAEIQNLRLENAYYRQQLSLTAPPRYVSGRWVRQSGANIQPQLPRVRPDPWISDTSERPTSDWPSGGGF